MNFQCGLYYSFEPSSLMNTHMSLGNDVTTYISLCNQYVATCNDVTLFSSYINDYDMGHILDMLEKIG